jgi:serine/threonine-protein kinase RsbT
MTATVLKSETVPIRNSADVVTARQRVRVWATELRFSLVDQTKVVTAASEIARNTLEHGGGGEMELAILENGIRKGIRLTFRDQGKGIPDIKQALTDGFTTGSGLGLGLGGTKRLMNEFDIHSQPGRGTTVVATRWK